MQGEPGKLFLSSSLPRVPSGHLIYTLHRRKQNTIFAEGPNLEFLKPQNNSKTNLNKATGGNGFIQHVRRSFSLDHSVSSYAQTIRIPLREKEIPFKFAAPKGAGTGNFAILDP